MQLLPIILAFALAAPSLALASPKKAPPPPPQHRRRVLIDHTMRLLCLTTIRTPEFSGGALIIATPVWPVLILGTKAKRQRTLRPRWYVR